jgi:hypothetical protein
LKRITVRCCDGFHLPFCRLPHFTVQGAYVSWKKRVRVQGQNFVVEVRDVESLEIDDDEGLTGDVRERKGKRKRKGEREREMQTIQLKSLKKGKLTHVYILALLHRTFVVRLALF